MIDLMQNTQAKPSEDKLSFISQLAEKQVEATAVVAELTNKLELATRTMKDIAERQLPEAMLEIGLTSLTLRDGTKLTIQKAYQASISEDRRPFAHNWLREKGFADLIKNEVKVTFGKGEDEKAKELMDIARQHGYAPINKEAVHPQTLKAFVKEQLEAGALPDSAQKLLGVFISHVAKIGKK